MKARFTDAGRICPENFKQFLTSLLCEVGRQVIFSNLAIDIRLIWRYHMLRWVYEYKFLERRHLCLI